MLRVDGYHKYVHSYSAGSESDVYRRQTLTSKVDPRAVRVKGHPQRLDVTIMYLDHVLEHDYNLYILHL